MSEGNRSIIISPHIFIVGKVTGKEIDQKGLVCGTYATEYISVAELEIGRKLVPVWGTRMTCQR